MAQQLAAGLYAIEDPFSLQIRARQLQIDWCVDVPFPYVSLLENYVYSLYPSAAVLREPEIEPDIGYFVYELQGAVPFFMPLSYATEFGEVDPLAGILTVMTTLEADEECVISLTLSPPTKNYPRIGQRLITQPRNSWWQFLSPNMAMETVMWQSVLGVERRLPKYEGEIQREATRKLRMSLKEVRLFLKIKAQSQARADDLFMQLAAPAAIYGRDGLNALMPAQQHSYQLILAPAEVAALWHLPNEACNVPGISWTSDKLVPPPIELMQATDGIVLGRSSYRSRHQDVRLADSDRVTHINILGRTRTGKSTFMHHMIRQDIEAGKGIGILDPHGQLVQDVLQYSIPAHREDDVVLFDWEETEKPIGLNPLFVPENIDASVAASLVLGFMLKYFGDAWIEGRMEDTVYACLVSLMSVRGSVIPDIPRILLDSSFRQRVLEHVNDFAALDYWHLEFESASPKIQQELARPVNTRMRKFYRGQTLRRIVGQADCLDIAGILDGRKIFLANLRGTTRLEGNSIGKLLIAQFQMAAMSRARRSSAEREPFYLYIDEVQSFVTTSLPEMYSEAAKYGMSLTTANQYAGQLDTDTAKSLLGNAGNNIIFRASKDDASLFAPLIEPGFSADDLVNLSRFKALVKMQQQGVTLPAFLIDLYPPPPPIQSGSGVAERIAAKSRKRYGKPVAEIDAELAARYRRDASGADTEAGDQADGTVQSDNPGVSGEQFYG